MLKLKEKTSNAVYFVEVYESSHYTVQVVKNKVLENWIAFEVNKKLDNKYLPKIYIFEKDENEYDISIQTTSYGEMEYKHYKDYIDAQNKALEVLPAIEKLVKEKLLEEND